VEGRRLIERCQPRPIAHVAAEMGISRQCASKWVNRHRRFGEACLVDRPSIPHHQPTATSAQVVVRIEVMRRDHKWSADEQARTAIAFTHRARAFFTAHGIQHIHRIVTDNGACYRARDFAAVLRGARHQRITPYTPRHNGTHHRRRPAAVTRLHTGVTNLMTRNT
jgi:hypothetical protein